MRTRVIPVLLLKGQGLVKTIQFKQPTYIGDPINTINIFNEKEVDELMLLDIDATPSRRAPNFRLIEDVAGEAFVPLAYGGGITSLDQAARIYQMGIEKVVIGAGVFDRPEIVSEIAAVYGAQAVVGCIDVRKTLFGGYQLFTHGGSQRRRISLDAHLATLQRLNVGEILVNSIDRDGTQMGYDLALIRHVASRVELPIVACGGAGSLDDLRAAVVEANASAVAAGSLFSFRGKHRAVLINYPERRDLEQLLP